MDKKIKAVPYEEDTELLITTIENMIGKMGQYLENSRSKQTFQNVAIYTDSHGKLWYGDIEKDKVYSVLEKTKEMTNETVYLISADDIDNTHQFMSV